MKTDLIQRARLADERVKYLRDNITYSEERILILLTKLNEKFIFQEPFFDEWYFLIADFYLPKRRLIIEVDGVQHGLPSARKKEAKRRRWLAKQGVKVLRIKNKAADKMTAKELEKRLSRFNKKKRRRKA